MRPESEKDIIAIGNLCQLVGSCLHNFSRVEESLAALYGIAAQMPSIEAAFKTHDEIREFQYRINATDAVVRHWASTLDDDVARQSLLTEWNTLHRQIKEDSQDRNKLAHFRLSPHDNDDGTTTWYVCPYFQIYSHLAHFKASGEKLKIPDGVRKFDVGSLEAKMAKFERTSKRIDGYINRLLELGARLPG